MGKIFHAIILLFSLFLIAGCSYSNENITDEPKTDSFKLFNVSYLDYDGSLIVKYEVREGYSAPNPVSPSREGYVFNGWDQRDYIITEDTEFVATYEVIKFNVIYLDNDGNTIQEYKVNYGDDAPIPSDPYKDGFVFEGWDIKATNVKEDLNVVGSFLPFSFDITNGEIVGYSGTNSEVFIPARIREIPVLSIGEEAFKDKNIESVVLPDSLKFIGDRAFINNKLSNLIIPNGVLSIGTASFADNQIESVSIPNSVIEIGPAAFLNNQLTTIDLPNRIREIRKYTFADNFLSSIEIPDSVTEIGTGSFFNNKLSSVSISNSLTSIGDSAFSNNQLTNLFIPISLNEIGDYAFRFNQIRNLFIPENVNMIGDYAFADNNLSYLELAEGLTSIGRFAFTNNYISNINIPSTVEYIGESAFWINEIKSIKIEGNIVRFNDAWSKIGFPINLKP